ncbi:MAG: glycosyltransferase family 2 protein [Candidatus Acidiferrum sp.]
MSVDSKQPLVTVLTPVYNGEAYLRECIESVLAQTYSNWEYCIINNCSKDRTLEIAEEYARRDARIRILNNTEFVGVIQNHNIAFRQISAESKYCKLVLADDWIFPECIEQMVRLAETHPTVGVVSAYGLQGRKVVWDGLPYLTQVMPGREICRYTLLGGEYVFGSPTTILMRSDLIRRQDPFYDEANLHADYAVCFDLLQDTDFGFIHQVLSFSRVHQDSVSSFSHDYNTYLLGTIAVLLKYGPLVLTGEELRRRKEFRMKLYYAFLARSAFRLRGREFWSFHRKWMRMLGEPIRPGRLLGSMLRELGDGILHPGRTISGIWEWWPRVITRMRPRRSG